MKIEPAIQTKAKEISLRFIVVFGVFLLALLLFGIIADEMVIENENQWDYVVFQKLAAITHPSVTRIMLFITFFGSVYFLLPAYILLVGFFLFFKKRRKLSLDVAAVGITSSILLFSLKDLFHRQRPMHPLVSKVHGFSFPSGHSFSSFTFSGLLIYILWNLEISPVWRWISTILSFLFACIIAFSRVYLHVHFASDVIAGFCLCIIWLSLSFWLIKKFSRKLP
ncbi:MAG: phosphatase PAP2 family protein [Flavisolibacter sp.]|nr:phosphatase PAP2 family protein [Flavisolibacter sp.]MBD0286379.1 phosphatase PAP2 family protein [Flavisolibacter sp.]MBD0352161.1 phosphatase PAP2 family protein [Flavisolibacter sp.]